MSLWVSRWLVTAPRPFQIVDHPNRRSLHDVPRQRTGGLAILSSLLVGVIISTSRTGLLSLENLQVGLGVLLVAAVSFWDDRRGAPPTIRLAVHAIAAVLIVSTGLRIDEIRLPVIGVLKLRIFATPVTLLFIMWLANLFNFMDGLDGLAAGMSVWGFAGLAALVFARGSLQLAVLCALIAAAAGGFLISNLPPARLFMGDVGSVPLGFLAGVVSLRALQQGTCDIWVPVLLFSPFIVDATVVLLRRLIRGARVWEAHREHAYQRLVMSGWSHRQTLLAEYAMMASSGLGAAIYAFASADLARLMVLITAAVGYTALLIFVSHQSSIERAVQS